MGDWRMRPLGHIEKLIVENFKSYEGRHEIGPFDKFTCIIGPNGSGKSNIMDAISFCLGIKAKHLRGDRLKDLVYRREEEDVDSNTRRASATICFRNSKNELLHFCRVINLSGEGTYKYGASEAKIRNVGYEEFLAILAAENIFVKARNFLVFQGDVMDLARRQGLDLTGVLETISGSDQMKEEYNRLSRSLEVAQEKARMYFQHRREVEGGVALLEQQRAEVERYQELRKERDSLGIEMVLFKLFSVEAEASREQDTLAHQRTAMTASEVEYRGKRRDAEEEEAQRKKADIEAEQAMSQYFVLSSNQEQLKPEISNCKKQIAHWTKKLKEKEGIVKDEGERQTVWETTLKQTRADRARAEADVARLRTRQVPSVLQLTDAQRAEFERAVAKTDSVNTHTREQAREAEGLLASCARDLAADKRDFRDHEDRRAKATARLEALGHERASLNAEFESQHTLLSDSRRQLAIVEEEVRRFADFRDTLGEEHRALRHQLDLARARRERLDQVDSRQRLADELRGAFPDGIFGRLSEMVLPTQKRFDLPLQMCMGSMAEAFVVTDANVGRQCVRYLKERRIGSETFLSLDRMEEPRVGPLHVLTQGKSARRLATLCVQHNEKFLERHPRWQADGPSIIDKAVAFLLVGTIIVDDLQEAKATAFKDARGKGLMPRVVTLEGEVIAPNGNMSVQSIGSFGRVEFGGAEQLHEIKRQEQKLAQVEKDLGTLKEEFVRKTAREVEMRERVSELEGRRSECVNRLQNLDGASADLKRLSAGSGGRIEELSTKVERGAQKLEELEKSKDALEAELLALGKNHFEHLNKELGVEDVREVAQREQRERKKMQAETEQYEDFIRTLQTEERSLEQKVRAASRLEALRHECEQYHRDIEAVTIREQELEERARLFEERCEKAKLRRDAANAAKAKLDAEVKATKVRLLAVRAQVEDLRKKVKKQGDKIKLLLSYRFGVFRENLDKLSEIPLLKGADGPMEQMLSREKDLDDFKFEELEAAHKAVQVDFTGLPEDRRELAEQTKIYDSKDVDLDYDAKIAEVARELSTLNPNMRAVEQCESETAKLQDIRKKADESTTDSQRLTREFEAVRAERLSRFMKCFKHVETTVHPFYRELTAYDGAQGGSAYLDLDDAEEPYNGGITFTACPPGKRFFPMELLSGGEKSMASMALLFAMHSYQPPPFMILDEVDAPFDRKNTNSLVSYLRKLEFQCLVISLKDSFFSHSDAIVGIFKDKEEQTSGSLTLPLKNMAGGLEEEAKPSKDHGNVD